MTNHQASGRTDWSREETKRAAGILTLLGHNMPPLDSVLEEAAE